VPSTMRLDKSARLSSRGLLALPQPSAASVFVEASLRRFCGLSNPIRNRSIGVAVGNNGGHSGCAYVLAPAIGISQIPSRMVCLARRFALQHHPSARLAAAFDGSHGSHGSQGGSTVVMLRPTQWRHGDASPPFVASRATIFLKLSAIFASDTITFHNGSTVEGV
jgi:hypothetical protein